MGTTERLDYSPQNRNLEGQWGKWKGKACLVEGCSKKVVCRGYCSTHYNKKRWADGHRSPSNNPESNRKSRLKYYYGITHEEYDKMFASQDGKCAICKQFPTKNVRAHWGGKLCVDHCHETGKVRGLLCNDCNLAIGYAKSEENLFAMVEYIRLHN